MRPTFTILLLLISLSGLSQKVGKVPNTYINAALNLPAFTDINQLNANLYLGAHHKEYQLSASFKGNFYTGIHYYDSKDDWKYKELSIGYFNKVAKNWFTDVSAGYGDGTINPGEYTLSKDKKRILYGTYDVTLWNYDVRANYKRYYFQATTYTKPAPNTKLGLCLRASKVNYSQYDYKLVKESKYEPIVYIDEEVSTDNLTGIILDPAIFLTTGGKHLQFHLQIGKSLDKWESDAINQANLQKPHPQYHTIYINTGLTVNIN